MRTLSLESRLCLLVTGLLLLLSLAILLIGVEHRRDTVAEANVETHQGIARAFAAAYDSIPSSDHHSAICKGFADRLLASNSEIMYVAVLGPGRKVVFADMRDLPTSRFHRMRKQDVPIEQVSAPVLLAPQRMGAVNIGFRADAAHSPIEAWVVFLVAVILLVGICGSLGLARSVTRPVQDLTYALRALGSGDMDTRVRVSSDREIAKLEDAFNKAAISLRNSHDRLVEAANTDSLTKLYNHKYFHERLSVELGRAARYRRPLAVVMLDIDHFKLLNDAHGHQIGDAVLQDVASIIANEARAIDVVSRYGGEEFAVIMPETSSGDALAGAERLRLAVQRRPFSGRDGECAPVTISLGVAQYPIHSTDQEGLILAADLAMYQAKSMGRNRSVVFSSDIRSSGSQDPRRLCLLLQAMDMETIEALAVAIDAKGRRRSGFSRGMTEHCVQLAQELGLSEGERGDVRIASLLHDIGKLAIPEETLNKPEPLTDDERRAIQSHPSLGYAIVQKSPHLKSMLPGILHHHERWDGNGYPTGLKGEEIPLIARIISVADAYQAMLTQRPQRETMTPERAQAELTRCSGSQFDPGIVQAFLTVLARSTSRSHVEAA